MLAGSSLPDKKHRISIKIGIHSTTPPTPAVIPAPTPPPIVVQPAAATESIPAPAVASSYRTFQIIPHTNVKNEKCDQFADVIADSFKQLIDRVRSWRLADPDRIFFETILTHQSYETFITTNSDCFDMVKQHAQTTWKHVTLSDTTGHLPDMEPSHVDAYDLKLRYPSFMSLKTDRRLQEMPLPEILEVSRAMQDGDAAVIQFGFQAAESAWVREAERSQEDFEKRRPKEWRQRDLHPATITKTGQYGFEFALRVMVSSPDARRRSRIARSLILALKQLKQDNELVEKKMRPYRLQRWLDAATQYKIKTPLLFGTSDVITSHEIAHFVKLPQRNLQDEAKIITTVSNKEVSLPDELTQDGIRCVRIGWVTERGERKLARIPLEAYGKISQKAVYDALCTSSFGQGMQGTGKSEGFGTVWAYDMVMAGFTAIVIDTADGQMLRNFIDSLPADFPDEKIHALNLDDRECPIALGWDDVYGRAFAGQSRDQELAALEISERLTARFVGFINSLSKTGEFTDRMQQYVVSCMRAVTTRPHWSFLDLELALTSPAYRTELLARQEVRNMPDVVRDLGHLQTKAAEGKDGAIIDPIMSRIRTLSSTQFLANLFYQEPKRDTAGQPALDLRRIMDNPEGGYGHVVCIQASHDAWQEHQATILGFFEDKINFNAFSRIDMNQVNRKPVLKWIDEPHKVIRAIEGKLAGTAVEFRKYRVKNLFTGHSIDQMGAAADALLDGGAQITSYKTKRLSELSRFAHSFAPYDDAKELYDALPEKWRAVNAVRLPSGKSCPAFIADMAPPPPPVKDRAYIWRQCSERYGRHWKTVRDSIQNKRAMYQEKDAAWHAEQARIAEAAKEEAKTAKQAERKAKKQEGA